MRLSLISRFWLWCDSIWYIKIEGKLMQISFKVGTRFSKIQRILQKSIKIARKNNPFSKHIKKIYKTKSE